MPVVFRITNEIVEIFISDNKKDLRAKLKYDNAFTTKFVKKSVSTGKIIVSEPIEVIERIISDTEEELIYTADPINNEEPMSVEEPADNEERTANEEFADNIEPVDNAELMYNEDPIYNEDPMDNEEPATQPSIEPELSAHPNNDEPPQAKEKQVSGLWADEPTKLILDNFHSYLTEIGPMKRFKRKKHVWEQISKDLLVEHNIIKSALQVENRYKTIVRRKKAAITNNSKTGRFRQIVPFEAEISKIASLDDSIAPQIIRSAKSVKTFKEPAVEDDLLSDKEVQHSRKENDNPTVLTNNNSKKRKISSIAETLVILHKEKEACRQARHKEKLELIRDIFGKTS